MRVHLAATCLGIDGYTFGSAYVVNITGGTDVGHYVFQDTDGNGSVAATELVVKLTGTSITGLVAANFVA